MAFHATNVCSLVLFMVHNLNVYVLVQQVSYGEEVVFPTRVVHHRSLVHIQDVQVYVWNLHHGLQQLHFIVGVFSFLYFILRVEAVEDGRSAISVQRIYLHIIVKQELADFRRGIKVGRAGHKMVQGVLFVHVLKIGFGSFLQDILNLLQSVVPMILDDFNEGDLVL